MPEIVIDENLNSITVSGNSIPEDSKECWYPFINEFEYLFQKWPKITFNFKFDIYNTATTSHIAKIFDMLFKVSQKKEVVINWFYLLADEDMMEEGETYKYLYNFKNFNLIEKKY